MRIPAYIITGGMGAVVMTDPVPPSPGVSIDRAKRACQIAQGTWDDGTGDGSLLNAPAPTSPAGCRLPNPEAPPSWCDYVPFSTSVIPACKLPDATELTQYGSYTAYKIAQQDQVACQPTYVNGQLQPAAAGCTQTGEQAAQQAMDSNAAQSQDLVDQAGCSYAAAQNHPWLSSMVGPDTVCSLADPFGPGSKGWMIYAALAVGGVLLISVFMGGRR